VGKRDLWGDEHHRQEDRRRKINRGEDLRVPSQLLFFRVRVAVSLGARSAFQHTLPPLVVRRGEWQAIGRRREGLERTGACAAGEGEGQRGDNARSHGRLSAEPAGGSIDFLKKG